MNKKSLRWALKVFVLSISLSIVFSLLSQSLLPSLSSFMSIFVIVFFIFVSVVFDMIAVAFTTISEEKLEKYKEEKGYEMAMALCRNADKVSSFGGDVVGDICGILSGAGGVSLVVNMNLEGDVNLLVTCLVSALIAGITIFCKAIMKSYAITNCDKIALLTGAYLETTPFKHRKKQKEEEKNKKN